MDLQGINKLNILKLIKCRCTPKFLQISLFFICFIGLIFICRSISRYVSTRELLEINLGSYSWYFADKPRKVFLYLLLVPTVFLYFCACYYLYNFNQRFKIFFDLSTTPCRTITIYVACALCVNGLIYSLFGPILKSIVWLIIFFWPLMHGMTSQFLVPEKWINKIASVGLVISLNCFAYIFIPLLFGEARITNDYLNIPETTIMPDGSHVDNFRFINKHKLFGQYERYDIRNHNQDIYSKNSIRFANTDMLALFVESKKPQKNAIQKVGRIDERSIIPLYEIQGNRLFIFNGMSEADYNFLYKMVASTDEERKALDQFYFTQFVVRSVNLTAEQNYFLKNNGIEQEWQSINRGMFSHFSFSYYPILQLEHGRPASEIYSIYGHLPSLISGKLLKIIGEFNLGTFVRLNNVWYFCYLLMAIFVSYIIFKDVKQVCIISCATIISSLSIHYLAIIMAYGYNPIRHFLDFPVAMFVYLYTTKERRVYLIIASILSCIAIGLNSHFGSCLALALLGTLVIKILFEKKYFDIVMLFLLSGFSLFALLFSSVGPQKHSAYLLEGMSGWPIESNYLYSIIATIFLLYILFINFHKVDYKQKYLGMFLLLYVQGILIYFIVCPQYDHFLPLFSVITFTFLTFISFILNKLNIRLKNLCWVILIVSIFTMFANSYSSILKSKRQFEDIFENHVTFKWDYVNTNFISTIDPKYFADSKVLIDKYANNSAEISLLSKFDSLLLLFSNKYNNICDVDITNALVEPEDSKVLLDKIERVKPRYLFVDRDMFRPVGQDLIAPTYMGLYVFNESLWRVFRLMELQALAKQAIINYKPIESSTLITVYERIE